MRILPGQVSTNVRRLLVLLATTASAVLAQGPGTRSGAVMLRPNDALKITVWESPNLSGEFDVGEDGTLRHPVYGQIRVVGISADSVRVLLTGLLKTFQREPLFIIEPLIRVSVSGQVRSPNTYLVRPDAVVADAVLKAGGTTDRAAIQRVVVERTTGPILVDITRSLGTGTDVLQSGDRVTVPTRRSSLSSYIGTVASLLAATASILLVIRSTL